MPSTCANPRCHCDPCTCALCRCGPARLGELERRVMEVLWASDGRPMTGRDVANVLDGHAYTTIATVLDRLVRKGEVRRERAGHVLAFTATESSASHAARAMREVLDLTEDRLGAVRRLGGLLTDDEADEMRDALHRSAPAARRRSEPS